MHCVVIVKITIKKMDESFVIYGGIRISPSRIQKLTQLTIDHILYLQLTLSYIISERQFTRLSKIFSASNPWLSEYKIDKKSPARMQDSFVPT